MLICSRPLPRSRSSSRFFSPFSRFSPRLSIVARNTSGIGHHEIRRRQRVDELSRIEIDLARGALVEPFDLLDRALDPARGQQITLLDEIEQRIVAPRLVAKAAVLGGRFDDRLGLAAEKPRASCSATAADSRSTATSAPARGATGPTSSAPSFRKMRRRSPSGWPCRSRRPRLPVLARQKIGDQPLAFLGDFGQMPRQLGLIHLALSRRLHPPRRNSLRFCPARVRFSVCMPLIPLVPRAWALAWIGNLKCSDAVPAIEYTAGDHAEYRAGIRSRPEVRACRPPCHTGRVRRRRRRLYRRSRDLSRGEGLQQERSRPGYGAVLRKHGRGRGDAVSEPRQRAAAAKPRDHRGGTAETDRKTGRGACCARRRPLVRRQPRHPRPPRRPQLRVSLPESPPRSAAAAAQPVPAAPTAPGRRVRTAAGSGAPRRRDADAHRDGAATCRARDAQHGRRLKPGRCRAIRSCRCRRCARCPSRTTRAPRRRRRVCPRYRRQRRLRSRRLRRSSA